MSSEYKINIKGQHFYISAMDNLKIKLRKFHLQLYQKNKILSKFYKRSAIYTLKTLEELKEGLKN